MEMTQKITLDEFKEEVLLSEDAKLPIDDFLLESLVQTSRYGVKSYFILSDDGAQEPNSVSFYKISGDIAFEVLSLYAKAIEDTSWDSSEAFTDFIADVRMSAINNEERQEVDLSRLFGGDVSNIDLATVEWLTTAELNEKYPGGKSSEVDMSGLF